MIKYYHIYSTGFLQMEVRYLIPEEGLDWGLLYVNPLWKFTVEKLWLLIEKMEVPFLDSIFPVKR